MSKKRFAKILFIALAIVIRILMIIAGWFMMTHVVIPQEKSENPTDVYNTVMSDPRFSNTSLMYTIFTILLSRGIRYFRGCGSI